MICIFYFLAAVICTITVYWVYFTSTRYWKLCMKIPGPLALPIVGNLHQICGKGFVRNVMQYAEQYYPIGRVFFSNFCFVLLQDPDDINVVLHSSKTLSKTLGYAPLRRILGNNVLTSNRQDWRKFRRIMDPSFRSQVVKTFITVFNEKANHLIKILYGKENCEQFDIFHLMCMLTLDMISETSLGVNANILENNRTDFTTAVQTEKQLIQKCISEPWFYVDIVCKNSETYQNAWKAGKTINSFIRDVFNKKRKQYLDSKSIQENQNQEDSSSKPLKSNFLNNAFELASDKKVLTDKELRNQALILTVAGMESSGFTLSVCIKLLGLHKGVQDKAVAELHDIFDDDINRPAVYEDLQRMKYIEQVIKETMRLFPISFVTGRRADEDIEIGGYIFPAGTDIIFSPYLLHRNPKYFSDPLAFDPERFSAENCQDRNPHCYLPFLSGPRMCIGHYYAMLQMKIVVSTILRHFEILSCGNREEMEEIDMSMLLGLKNGYNVSLKSRLND